MIKDMNTCGRVSRGKVMQQKRYYLLFNKDSEAALALRNVRQNIKNVEDRASEFARKFGADSYLPFAETHFGGISALCYEGDNAPSAILQPVLHMEEDSMEDDGKGGKVRVRWYTPAVKVSTTPMREDEAERLANDVLHHIVGARVFSYKEITPMISMAQAAEWAGYQLTGDDGMDKTYLERINGQHKYRLVTEIMGEDRACPFYHNIQALPVLNVDCLNKAAGIVDPCNIIGVKLGPDGDVAVTTLTRPSDGVKFTEITERQFAEFETV